MTDTSRETFTDTLVVASIESDEAAPLLAELEYEYTTRYEDYDGFDKDEDAPEEIDLFPPLVFSEPLGSLLLVRRDGRTIAGGAFMYLDEETAEIKRVWTSTSHRRQGLSRRVMGALESAVAERGYRRIYLTTGPRQPEAVKLYLSLGYTPLFDVNADPEDVVHLAFEKEVESSGVLPDIHQDAEDAVVARAAAQRDAVEATYRWRPRPELRLVDLDRN
ncbi:GNAT family N-acetyltransferase [Corynebacterium variabile]|uniref:GNAT family N-acetyltransferase n=1 Tax=Corynebacterium variabile TaxID=1727 RepID=UPI003F989D98